MRAPGARAGNAGSRRVPAADGKTRICSVTLDRDRGTRNELSAPVYEPDGRNRKSARVALRAEKTKRSTRHMKKLAALASTHGRRKRRQRQKIQHPDLTSESWELHGDRSTPRATS
jgi:hypothetical protein